jgi:sRNA-binding protein
LIDGRVYFDRQRDIANRPTREKEKKALLDKQKKSEKKPEGEAKKPGEKKPDDKKSEEKKPEDKPKPPSNLALSVISSHEPASFASVIPSEEPAPFAGSQPRDPGVIAPGGAR